MNQAPSHRPKDFRRTAPASLRRAAFIFCFAFLCLSGRAVTFVACNFEIQIPDNWPVVNPSPAGALAAYQNPDKSKMITLTASALPPAESGLGIAEALEGAKKAIARHNVTFDPEKKLTVGVVPFRYFTARGTTGISAGVYAAEAGKELYIVGLVDKTGDTATDAELQSILQSFHLLTPAAIPTDRGSAMSSSARAGYRIGYMIGRLAFWLGVLLGCFLVIFVVWSARKR